MKTEKDRFKTVSLEEVKDELIGKIGTPDRDAYERELQLDLLGHAIKEARMERQLTQEQLGELVGVQKAQISKIERNAKSARLDTLLKVFSALRARISFQVELEG